MACSDDIFELEDDLNENKSFSSEPFRTSAARISRPAYGAISSSRLSASVGVMDGSIAGHRRISARRHTERFSGSQSSKVSQGHSISASTRQLSQANMVRILSNTQVATR